MMPITIEPVIEFAAKLAAAGLIAVLTFGALVCILLVLPFKALKLNMNNGGKGSPEPLSRPQARDNESDDAPLVLNSAHFWPQYAAWHQRQRGDKDEAN